MIIEDEEFLSKPCESTDIEEGRKIINLLADALKNSQSEGIGLAANQIGIQKRVCILRIPEKKKVYGYDLINPKIVSRTIPVIVKGEGCLSFPNQFIKTFRYLQVKVVDDLMPEGQILNDWAAVCAQHEIDHLDGVTMYSRALSKLNPTSLCQCESGKVFKDCCHAKLIKDLKII